MTIVAGAHPDLDVPMPAMPKPRSCGNWTRIKRHGKYISWREEFQHRARAAYRGDLLTGYLSVRVEMRYARGLRADGDNCFGAVLDALSGIIWPDDRMIREGCYRIITDCGTDSVRVWVKMVGIAPQEVSGKRVDSLTKRGRGGKV